MHPSEVALNLIQGNNSLVWSPNSRCKIRCSRSRRRGRREEAQEVPVPEPAPEPIPEPGPEPEVPVFVRNAFDVLREGHRQQARPKVAPRAPRGQARRPRAPRMLNEEGSCIEFLDDVPYGHAEVLLHRGHRNIFMCAVVDCIAPTSSSCGGLCNACFTRFNISRSNPSVNPSPLEIPKEYRRPMTPRLSAGDIHRKEIRTSYSSGDTYQRVDTRVKLILNGSTHI